MHAESLAELVTIAVRLEPATHTKRLLVSRRAEAILVLVSSRPDLASSGSCRCVAIVDDEAPMSDALLDRLEEAGFPACAFALGEEFLASGPQHECSCVIADIHMPGMSGLDLQCRLNAEWLHIAVIFITAHGDERTRMRAVRGGAVDFLPKPFDGELLLDTPCERRWSARNARRPLARNSTPGD